MATRYVSVPQEDGEVVLTIGAAEPRRFLVDQGLVSARTLEEEQALLRHVDGAARATRARVAKVKGAGTEQPDTEQDTDPGPLPADAADPSTTPDSPAPVGVQPGAPAPGDTA